MERNRAAPPAHTAPLQLAGELLAVANPQTDLSLLTTTIAHLFPGLRLDALIDDAEGMPMRHLLSISDAEATVPSDAFVSQHAFTAWLSQQGYASIERHPLLARGRLIGWLICAQRPSTSTAKMNELVEILAGALILRYDAQEQERLNVALHHQLRIAEARTTDGERLQRQALWAADAAYDIGNLLTVILGHAELLQQDLGKGSGDDLWAIVTAAQDGRQIIRRVLARESVPPAVPVYLRRVIREALTLTQPFWKGSVQVVFEDSPAPPVLCDPVQIREVLINLLLNVTAAMPYGGTLTVRARVDHEWAMIEISDTGTGTPAGRRDLVFEPLQARRSRGSGLGLAISQELVERAGGKLSVVGMPGGSATFTIALPLLQ